MIPIYKQQLKGLGAAAVLTLALMGYLSTASLVESGSVGETLAGARREYNRVMQSEQVTTVQAQINALQEEYRAFQVDPCAVYLGFSDRREVKRDGPRSDFDGIGVRRVGAAESCCNGPVKQRRREAGKQPDRREGAYQAE